VRALVETALLPPAVAAVDHAIGWDATVRRIRRAPPGLTVLTTGRVDLDTWAALRARAAALRRLSGCYL
jgi:hypothetical protein